ncbi:hypothetical protein OROGR_007596 [Orobanche gracilis]
MTKQLAYLIYNTSILFSSTVQKQYRQKFGKNKMLPVAESDLAFSLHVVVVSAVTMYQIAIYDRGSQKFSKIYVSLVVLFVLAAAVCVFIAIPRHSWFWLVSCFNTIQVVMTIVKYIPQVTIISTYHHRPDDILHAREEFMIMTPLESYLVFPVYGGCDRKTIQLIFNYQRKSTSGFSIGNVLLDFLGGVANNLQMVMQSLDQNSWENFYGNLGKSMLALLTIVFDIIFMIQHYALYPTKKADSTSSVANVELPRAIEEC